MGRSLFFPSPLLTVSLPRFKLYSSRLHFLIVLKIGPNQPAKPNEPYSS